MVLVVGVEQMTTTPGPEIGKNLLKASYLPEDGDTPGGFAGVFGKIAQGYFQKYGDRSDALAAIAAKNHKNGVSNPYAQMRKDLGFEFCRAESEKNPFVAGPLKRTDCSLVSDGAAALVLTDVETALGRKKAVAFRGLSHVQDFLPMSKRDILAFEGCGEAWRRALSAAGVGLDDLSFVETHDCFTIAELIEYEAMGLTKPGEGHRAILEGWTQPDGRLPVNPSGGLKAKGHPIGAHRGLDACPLGNAADRYAPAISRSRTPGSAAFSTWVERLSPTTCRCCNRCANELDRELVPGLSGNGTTSGRGAGVSVIGIGIARMRAGNRPRVWGERTCLVGRMICADDRGAGQRLPRRLLFPLPRAGSIDRRFNVPGEVEQVESHDFP